MNRFAFSSGLVLALVGCAGDPPLEALAPLLTVSGNVADKPSGVSGTSMGLTVVWLTTPPTAAGSSSVQSVPVVHDGSSADPCTWATQPPRASTLSVFMPITAGESVSVPAQFPLEFSLPLTLKPPTTSMVDLTLLGGRGKLAYGLLVAYDDRNGDGKLTLGTPAREPEPLLAIARTGTLVYLEGALVDSEGAPITKLPEGFSLVTGAGEVLAATTPIELATATLPATMAALFTCEALELRTSYGASPPPPGAAATCADARTQLWSDLSGSRGCILANRVNATCAADPKPADWPCR